MPGDAVAPGAPVRPHAVVAALASVLRNDPSAAERAARLRRRGVLVVGVPADADGHACLASTLELLRGHLGVRSVMIEGGASVIGSCIRAEAAHHVIITLAPKMLVNGLRPPLPKDMPDSLKQLLAKCWDKDPEVRCALVLPPPPWRRCALRWLLCSCVHRS